eukprot:TRINITY_DN68183_c5_g4_i1.p1 TRINITY_DN68183_c5_g4~~TRINITY_DN68183_c5_g4_i1.p1  ORF type:complete len:632 (+),score=30.90 TRINITY_DN68183_c5_g4_i1:176-2071(+)
MDASPSTKRVLPLLCGELLARSAPSQISNLKAFELNLDSLSRVEVTHNDAVRFIGVLFKLTQHKECSTNLQRQQQWDVALLCLRIMHRLFTTPSHYFERFLGALHELLLTLKMDNEHFYRRPSMTADELSTYGARRMTPPGLLPVSETPSRPATPSKEQEKKETKVDGLSLMNMLAGMGASTPKSDTLTSRSSSFRPPPTPVNVMTNAEKQANFLVPPTENKKLMPPGTVTDISAEALEQLKVGFDELDTAGNGEIAFNEMLAFAESCGKEFTMQMFKKLDKDGSGTLSFTEIVRYWYPKVSLRELTKKIAQLPPAHELRKKREREQLAAKLKVEAAIRQKKEAEEAKLYEEYLQWKRELDLKRRREAIRFDNEKQERWNEFCEKSGQSKLERVGKNLADAEASDPLKMATFLNLHQQAIAKIVKEVNLSQMDFHLDSFLNKPETRHMCTEILQALDFSGVNVCFLLKEPKVHLYLPFRYNKRCKVYRDFVQCPPAPKLQQPWRGMQLIHIKTNIPGKSDIMYRFVVEGFNYGVNAPIHSDIVGYSHRRWNKLGCMEDYGWPADWDEHTTYNYCSGASISQYMSSDHFVVIKLAAKSFFGVGFSASAFMLNYDYGDNFVVTGEVVFSQSDL